MQICVINKSQSMLNKISWSQFFWFLITVLILYYIYVAMTHFSKGIIQFFLKRVEKPSLSIKAQTPKQVLSTNALSSNEMQSEKQLSFIYDMLEDLKNLFSSASKTKIVKEELVQAIRTRLNNYAKIKDKYVLEELNQHICLEAKEQCGIDIYPEDIKRIWSS